MHSFGSFYGAFSITLVVEYCVLILFSLGEFQIRIQISLLSRSGTKPSFTISHSDNQEQNGCNYERHLCVLLSSVPNPGKMDINEIILH